MPHLLSEEVTHDFTLHYKSHHIGTLTFHNGNWSFSYSEYFKDKKPIQLIHDFSDVDKVYQFRYLHPFFSMRIPSLKQPKVKRIVETEKIDVHNEVDLLKRFGRITIANPFILQPA